MPSKKKTPTKKSHKRKSSSSDQTSGSKRKHPILITKPIILGNYAIGLKKKDTERLWCKWVCYVRGLILDDDLNYISKVVFHLHETFNPPVVTVTKPPFEIEQEGWGQFPLLIDIHFHASSGLDPIHLQYDLKLPSDNAIKKRKPFVSEQYEELLFYDPTEQFEQILKINAENVKNIIKKIKTATEASLKNESDSDNDESTSDKKSGAGSVTTNSMETSSFRPSVSAQIEQHAPILKEETSLKAITEMAEKLREQIKEREQPSTGTATSKSESGSRSSKSKKSKSNKKSNKKESDDEDDDDYVD
ncbi:hypothetical protein FDP41_007257 [Naegleria fowleri]|uniref:YEATS domain-containing protein n=1 Tax=Naegleria fowleri TaxID=5763 RepID=A0A6A5BIN6_NAEFO|nr:uncharacterized protein FDP41_007257 [Naegleria fowleri]KAF0973870.1 hypothetical protein FDP41_007257 [Naegleria fowleri]CAG4718187.1 unnamed protein product [Naegleria fowleri]